MVIQPDSKMPTDIRKGSRANIPDLSRQFYGAQIRNFGMIMANGCVTRQKHLAIKPCIVSRKETRPFNKLLYRMPMFGK